MSVQRMKMNTTAENIANAETTKTKNGGPYSRKRVMISDNEVGTTFAGEFQKANVALSRTHSYHRRETSRFQSDNMNVSHAKAKVHQNARPPVKMVYDPSHPDADPEGYVAMPDIDVVTEMVNMMSSARAFEANVTAVNATKQMIGDALEI